MRINGSLLTDALPVTNVTASGPIGAAADTVDKASFFTIPQTTAGIDLTLPLPTSGRSGQHAYIHNGGTAAFTSYGKTVEPQDMLVLYFAAGGWRVPVAASPTEWTLLTATPGAALPPGKYRVNSSGGAFAVLLDGTEGEWEFADPSMTTGINPVTVGVVGDMFTDYTGTLVAGPYLIDVSGAYFSMIGDGAGNYYIANEPGTLGTTTVPPIFVANGGWNASTNLPDLSVAANQGDGTNTFVYLITATGTQNIGAGSQTYEAGGQITFFDQAGTFRYDAPAAAGSAPLTAPQATDSVSVAVGTVSGSLLSQAVAKFDLGTKASYANAAARIAETGYAVTADDIANRRLFLQADKGLLYRATGAPGAVVWGQIGPVVDDQGASGYIDFATTRVQTGTFVSTLDGSEAFLFPNAFGAAPYSVIANIAHNEVTAINGRVLQSSISATGFSFNRDDVIANADDPRIHYIAIGPKP